jgi:predicted molibdopterin-dependent oxidoreductase YjgC
VFGAGGGTSSYREAEETDVIFLWGANPRENHPIFFHHVLKGVHNGARLYAVDPRRTSTAAWAHRWLGLNVGSDIALANAMARVIIHEGLANTQFIARATSGFAAYRSVVERYTLKRAERLTGVPAADIRDAALAYARADRAMICWTLGITEHHNAVDNVLALINLALLTGHVGRYGSGLNPLRGQNNVQGGGDMGAIPNRLPGFQDIHDPAVRARIGKLWAVTLNPEYGMHMSQMFEAMHHRTLRGLYAIGENPAQSEADQHLALDSLAGLDHLVVQDIFLTRTAQMAHVVLPASSSWCEAEGTVTNSERRVQRVRKALEPPGDARDDMWIIAQIAKRLGHDWGEPVAEKVWGEVRAVAPRMFGGMTYARLEADHGLQWPCPDDAHPGEQFLHARLWAEPMTTERAPFSAVEDDPPVERPSKAYPFQLTTGRRLDSYNTGVQSGGYSSPLRRPESLDLSPEDAARLGLADGDRVRVTSRRGSVTAPARVDPSLRPGLVFMTLHFQDVVATNLLTIDATDPKSGTAEFKASAVKLEPVRAAKRRGNGRARKPARARPARRS